MDIGDPLTWAYVFCTICVIASFLLYGFEAAVLAAGDSDIEQEEKEKKTRAVSLVSHYKDEPQRLEQTVHLVTILMAMCICGIIFSQSARPEHLGKSILPEAATLGYIITLILVFAVSLAGMLSLAIRLPQAIGRDKQLDYAIRLAGVVHSIVMVCTPIVFVTDAIAGLIAKVFGIDVNRQEDVTEEEIISMVNEGHEQGFIEADEAEMITNIFEMGDKEAQDIMTHRKSIIGVDGNIPLHEALDFILSANNSRFPVYEENIDNIIGIIHLKDAMKRHREHNYDNWLIKDIPGLIRPAVFIPETRNIGELFKSMQSKKLQMVIVSDEYGQTAGLVALEDILEEIVGNIEDEYDVEVPLIEKTGDEEYLISGMALLEDVEEVLDTELPIEDDIETMNGFMVSKLERIPSEDEHLSVQEAGFNFEILSVANKTVEKVKVTKISGQGESDDENIEES